MPTYILQKDLPNLKAGTQFILDDHNHKYYVAKQDDIYNEKTYYKKELVESDLEWFLEKEEDYKVIVEKRSFIINQNDNRNILVSTPINFSEVINKKIKEAIERVLNEDNEVKDSIDFLKAKYAPLEEDSLKESEKYIKWINKKP